MKVFKSHTDIEKQNIEKYWAIVQKLEPEYYLIRLALEQTNVNPMILPRVIRQIANMAMGTGYGKIVIEMEAGTILFVHGEERDLIKEKAIVDKEEDKLQ